MFKRYVLVLIIIIHGNVMIAGDSNMAPITSTRALSLGGYYYAGRDNVTSAYSNPAKVLCYPGIGFDINVNSIAGQNSLKKPDGDLHRSFLSYDLIGSAGLYWTKKRLGFGLIYNNQALHYSVRWPLAMLFEVNGSDRVYGYKLTSRLQADAISPVIGFKISQVFLGISANIYSINRELAYPMSNPDFKTNGGDPTYQLTMKQNGNAIAWNAGFLAMISHHLRIGGSIRTGVTSELSGNAFSKIFFDVDSTSQKSKVSSQIEIPLSGGLGIIYKLNDRMSVNLDATLSLWSNTASSVEYIYSDTAWVSRLPEYNQDSITGYYWEEQLREFENSLDIGLGIEYKTDSNMYYRFGYRFTQTPNSERNYSLLFPEVNRHWVSLGLGYQQGDYIFDLGIIYSVGISTKVSENDNQYFSGKYSSRTVIPSLNIRYMFN